MRSPNSTSGLQATVLTCLVDPTTAAFDSAALESFTASHAVIEVRDHAFENAGQLMLAFVIVHAGPRATKSFDIPQSTPPPLTESGAFSASHRPARSGDQLHIPANDRPLYDRLCAWRNAQARALGKPSYVLFRNLELAAVAARRPTSLSALMEIHGIGKSKAEQFGRALLTVVRECSARNDSNRSDEVPTAGAAPEEPLTEGAAS